MFGIDYFDSILLTGDYQAGGIRALEKLRGIPEKKLLSVGCPYLDVYREKMKEIPAEENHPFTVLVTPSWGPSALLARFGSHLLDPLVKTSWRIIVRPHPQSKKSETSVLENLKERYRDNTNLEWDYERENIYSLKKADIMISDFSGIIFDYAFLCDKPVMYVKKGIDLRPYDADDLGDNAANELWQFKILEQIGVELQEAYFDRIAEVIKNVSDNAELHLARRKAREDAWQHQGEAGKRIADFMLETVRGLA
jgi:CDP-glycerol glycerophosphotransferase (TagB/SpsB family)